MRAGPQASRRLAPSPNALKKVLRGDEDAHTQCRMIVDQRYDDTGYAATRS